MHVPLTDMLSNTTGQPLLLLLYITVALLLIGLGHSYGRVRRWFLLRRFPRIGIDPGPLGLWRAGAARQEFRLRGKQLAREGYGQYPDTAFVVETATGPRLIVPARLAEETRNWCDARLSHKIALLNRFQASYTGIDEVRSGSTHRDVVKVQLTQNLDALLPHMIAATSTYLRNAVQPDESGATVNAWHTGLWAISHMTSRVIIDDPISQNNDWMRVLVGYTEDAGRLAETLRQWPPYLRPLVYPFLRERRVVRADIAFIESTLKHIIAERRSTVTADKDCEGHIDLVRWLTDIEPAASTSRLVGIILFLIVAGIHTSAFTLTHALYSLCQLPDIQQELRAEIVAVLGDTPWTLRKLRQLRKMDSFLKENHRANPLGVFAYNRLVREDAVLSDGTHIPAGTTICSAREAYACDPTLYADPYTFDPKRYLDTPFSSTAGGDSWFGLGSQACPGRWYAEVQLKVILSLLLTSCNLSFPKGQVERPPNYQADEKILPSMTQDIVLCRLDVYYVWPNGQGDVGKFFGGAENRDAWEREHGAVYRIWNGIVPEVVLTRPEHVQAVFRDSNQHIKAIDNNTGWLLGALLGQCLGLISQEPWRRLRAITEPPFTRKAAATYVQAIDDRVQAHVQHLLVQQKKGTDHGIHPVNDFRFLAFWSIADVMYGKLPAELEARLQALVPLREALFHRAITGGWLRFAWAKYLPTATRRDLHRFKAEWAAINQAAYEHARSCPALQRVPIVTLMDATARDATRREELLQTLDEILFANLDVTMGGLSWNLLFLAAEPAVQAELRADIDSAQASGDWYGYLLSSSTLLAACIAESARLKPLAAFSIPQAAPTDRQIEDFVITAGTNFIIDTYAINVRNAFWGKDSHTFRPHRFLDQEAQQSGRYHYWRFGFGPRTCLGRYVADLFIRCVLVHLVHAHSLALHTESGAPDWKRKPESWISQADATIACTPVVNSDAAA